MGVVLTDAVSPGSIAIVLANVVSPGATVDEQCNNSIEAVHYEEVKPADIGIEGLRKVYSDFLTGPECTKLMALDEHRLRPDLRKNVATYKAVINEIFKSPKEEADKLACAKMLQPLLEQLFQDIEAFEEDVIPSIAIIEESARKGHDFMWDSAKRLMAVQLQTSPFDFYNADDLCSYQEKLLSNPYYSDFIALDAMIENCPSDMLRDLNVEIRQMIIWALGENSHAVPGQAKAIVTFLCNDGFKMFFDLMNEADLKLCYEHRSDDDDSDDYFNSDSDSDSDSDTESTESSSFTVDSSVSAARFTNPKWKRIKPRISAEDKPVAVIEKDSSAPSEVTAATVTALAAESCSNPPQSQTTSASVQRLLVIGVVCVFLAASATMLTVYFTRNW